MKCEFIRCYACSAELCWHILFPSSFKNCDSEMKKKKKIIKNMKKRETRNKKTSEKEIMIREICKNKPDWHESWFSCKQNGHLFKCNKNKVIISQTNYYECKNPERSVSDILIACEHQKKKTTNLIIYRINLFICGICERVHRLFVLLSVRSFRSPNFIMTHTHISKT